ncbi:hypothetical protein [uncultured Sphingomonas sp.]|uniref:hypothetical protein n=1 Tax=uncultured Sphingomonas sp. TaxID=158754 RepID=UPI0025CE6C1B|nr:hypothetical protein [uncultured Sphingomonas sp.]
MALIDTAARLVESEPGQARPQLAATRWTVARLLGQYQLFKHSEILQPAIRYGSAGRANRARELLALCNARGEQFHVYLKYWASHDVGQDWATYRQAMLDMAVTLRSALEKEDDEIAGFLAGVERTRQPNGWPDL